MYGLPHFSSNKSLLPTSIAPAVHTYKLVPLHTHTILVPPVFPQSPHPDISLMVSLNQLLLPFPFCSWAPCHFFLSYFSPSLTQQTLSCPLTPHFIPHFHPADLQYSFSSSIWEEIADFYRWALLEEAVGGLIECNVTASTRKH